MVNRLDLVMEKLKMKCLLNYRTWKNAQLMDNMIKQLEDQGLQMAKQKQVYFGRS